MSIDDRAAARARIEAIVADIERIMKEHPSARDFGEMEDREARSIVQRIEARVMATMIEAADERPEPAGADGIGGTAREGD